LAADVAGYSRLMGDDERATIATLNRYREVFRDTVEANRGRIVDMAGDSVLAIFETAAGAVLAAVAVQNALAERNADLASDRRMAFRIGVHLGDIFEQEDGSIYGDGVNVAARLESLAEPGRVCVSDMARGAVRGQLELGFTDLGEQTVKNIAEPVRAYQVGAAGANGAQERSAAAGQRIDKPSIAVLPFDNMSGDPEQEYFADGIAEDIITALARFRRFHVIARNSSFSYKGQAKDITKVGRELGVRYVLEGSVRKAGNRVRITAQLIESETGSHVWAERFDGQLEDVFDLQDRITSGIAAAVAPAFNAAELERISRKRPENLDAWDLTLQAFHHLGVGGRDDFLRAQDILQRAVKLDRRNTEALAALANCHVFEFWMGYTLTPESSVAEGVKAARLALRVDNTDAVSLCSLGLGLFAGRQYDEALDTMLQCVTQNPNYAFGWGAQGLGLAFSGRCDEAIVAIDRAIALSPRDPQLGWWVGLKSVACFIVRRYDEGAAFGRRSVQEAPDFMDSHRSYTANLSELGRLDEAAAEVAAMKRIAPGITVAQARATLPFSDDEAHERYCAALARAGLPME
jgi:adenylate cyclase